MFVRFCDGGDAVRRLDASSLHWECDYAKILVSREERYEDVGA
jgi:hypothetical protein